MASVADQAVELEHIVQDAGSDDGTLDWLCADRRVKAFVEADRGMYDAVNRGLRRARGEILAYLNCDEQYLPGALLAVRDYFDRHPGVEVVFADLSWWTGGANTCYVAVHLSLYDARGEPGCRRECSSRSAGAERLRSALGEEVETLSGPPPPSAAVGGRHLFSATVYLQSLHASEPRAASAS